MASAVGDDVVMVKRRRPRGVVVARIAGIDVRLHPTFLVFLGLAVVGLLGPPLQALAWLGLVFGSVVFHELAHSVTARRRGVAVLDIVLLPIGGMSELSRLPQRPVDEATIAAAGPLASYLLAAAAAAMAVASGTALLPVDLAGGPGLRQLVWFNVGIGTFNLLPALPMDGGRLLRAWLASRLPRDEATLRATAVSRVLAVLLATIGILVDVWLIVIAVFVLVTGSAEASMALVHARLEGMRVGDVMRWDRAAGEAATAGPDGSPPMHASDRLNDVLDELVEHDVVAVVDDHDEIIGVVTVDDVGRALRQRAA